MAATTTKLAAYQGEKNAARNFKKLAPLPLDLRLHVVILCGQPSPTT